MADRPQCARTRTLTAALLLALFAVAFSSADEPLVSLENPAAYPNGTFGEHLATASQGGDGPIGGSPHRTGPGRRDRWKVGPRWQATVDGVVLFRDRANMGAILGEVDPIAPQTALPPLEFLDNFDHAAGGRVMLTSEWPHWSGYDMQIGYLGVEKWSAAAYYDFETIPAASLPLSDVDVQQRRSLHYLSNLHAAEVNAQRASDGYLKPFAGFRFIGLDEGIADRNRQFTTGVLPDPVNVGDTVSAATTQTTNSVEIDNTLLGLHGGVRLDMWRPHRKFHVNGFLNAGVFCNLVDRDRTFQQVDRLETNERVTVPGTGGAADTEQVVNTIDTVTTTSNVSADTTRIAFVTEASLAGEWRLNSCTALRGGYQIMFLSGVELAESLWTAPPPVRPDSDDLFLHGWFAGFEYRR